MATTRRARGSRSRAVIAAGLLAAAAIATLPARSAEGDPVLMSTSVDQGWSNGKSVVARFDRKLATTSTAVVTRVSDGVAYDGTATLSYAEYSTREDVIVWTPNLTGKTDPNGLPLSTMPADTYSVTFTAVAHATSQTITVGPLTFKVDNTAPFAPEFVSPAAMEVLPSGDVVVSGLVSDRVGDEHSPPGAFRSGVSRVQLFFYNAASPGNYQIGGIPGNPCTLRELPEEPSTDVADYLPACNPGTPGSLTDLPHVISTEIASLRRNAVVEPCTTAIAACTTVGNDGTPTVKADSHFSSTMNNLGTGFWTVKAVAYDRAGNRSQEVSTTFFKAS